MSKKIVGVFLSIVLLLSFAGCADIRDVTTDSTLYPTIDNEWNEAKDLISPTIPQIQISSFPIIERQETTKKDTDDNSENNIVMVWIPNSGSKYHSYSGCSNMKNPSKVAKSEAEDRGYEPCKKCW